MDSIHFNITSHIIEMRLNATSSESRYVFMDSFNASFLVVGSFVALLAFVAQHSATIRLWFSALFMSLRPSRNALTPDYSETYYQTRNGSLRQAIYSFCHPVGLHNITGHWLPVWFRAFIGRSGSYYSMRTYGLTASTEQLFVLNDKYNVVFLGKGSWVNQKVVCQRTYPLHADATLWVGCFARHLNPSVVPSSGPFDGVIIRQTYLPGPFHVCGSSCSQYYPKMLDDSYVVQQFGKALYMHSQDSVHLAFEGVYHHVTLPLSVLLDSVSRYCLSSKATNYQSVSTTLALYRDAIPILMHCVANGLSMGTYRPPPSTMTMESVTDRTYNDIGTESSIVAVHNPLVSNSKLGFIATPDFLRASVYARNVLPATGLPFPTEYYPHLVRFVHAAVGGVVLCPLDMDSVRSRLTKSSQVQQFDDMGAYFDVARSTVSVFQKMEPLKSGGVPRVIVNPSGPTNFIGAAYIAPMMDALKQLPWFCCGWTPTEIESRVHAFHHELHTRKRSANETDFSNCDATTGTIGHVLMFAFLDRFYGDDKGWVQFLRASTAPTARTNFGVGPWPSGQSRDSPDYYKWIVQTAFCIGIGTLSGFFDTTTRNTVVNAFTAYCNASDSGSDHEDAYSSVCRGLYSGDDGLDEARLIPITTTAVKFGLDIKSRVYSSGYTTFLGRLYIDPWVGVWNSADPLRLITSFHLVTVPAGGTAALSLAYRAFGYLITDPHIPLFSIYWRNVLRHNPVTHLDPRYFDSHKFSLLSSQSMYTCSEDNDALAELFVLRMGISVEDYATLVHEVTTRPAVVGTTYSPISPLCFQPRPGSVLDGMPISDVEPPLPLVRTKADVEALEILVEDANHVAAAASADSVAIDVGLSDVMDAFAPPAPIQRELLCRNCSNPFIITDAEREHCEANNWDLPKKCSSCRASKKERLRKERKESGRNPAPSPAAPPADDGAGVGLPSDATVIRAKPSRPPKGSKSGRPINSKKRGK